MDQRIVDRLVASYEADIGKLKAQLDQAQKALRTAWYCCNQVINSGRCADHESLSATLEYTRDLVGSEMGDG